ncbi:MAG: hypothetical protein K8I60_13390, partial [Anaerolineae bacterium]|nr:hypothetical protein [Anaerolineae bacterium]
MHTRKFVRYILITLIISLIALLTVSPILSQGNGNGNGGNGGNGGGNGRDNAPGQVDNPGQGNPDGSHGNGNSGDRGNNGQRQSTPAPSTSNDTLLGCQKNNPDRLDCSSLEVGGVCEADTAVFTIRNTGEPGNGDMVSGTEYRLIVDGVIVETGTVQLLGGE